MSVMYRKKPFSTQEKQLFINIIQKYSVILTCKQTNATNALKKRQAWDTITKEFNKSSIVSQKVCPKHLVKLWYNMKAKAREREIKNKQNGCHLTENSTEGPSFVDVGAVDNVMDNGKTVVTKIELEIDSENEENKNLLGDYNNDDWCETQEDLVEVKKEEETRHIKPEFKTTTTRNNRILRIKEMDSLKCQILEEELEFKRKMHQEELNIKILEREYKEKLYSLELQIKMKELEKRHM